MQLTKYGFSHAVSAFFEMPTELAKNLLPRHLQPLEVQHGSAVFAVTAFDFTESMVGTYTEIVLAVIVPPLLEAGQQFPKSAFYPYLVGTNTPESRAHAIERWHLPHHMADVDCDFAVEGGAMNVRVHDNDKPILEMSVHEHEWGKTNDLYQAFMTDEQKRYKVDIHMNGEFSEHEEESGSLKLHNHPMLEKLEPAEINTYPFRELWMKQGMQTFNELETI